MNKTRVLPLSLLLLTGACDGVGADAADPGLEVASGSLTGTKLAVTLLSAPGWVTPANLLDGSTTTKSTNAAKTASVELTLAGNFQINTVRVAEDNAGAQNVDAFGIQCWNGTAYAPELFRELNTPVAVPGYNEHVVTGTTCTTSRVKVNLYNDAALEAMEIQLYGTPATPPPPPPNRVLVDIANGPNGTTLPDGQRPFFYGSDVNLHFDPAPGYRLATVCSPDYDHCQTLHDTEFTVKNVTSDQIAWATFEKVPAPDSQLPVTVLASTFQAPAAVVDADVTNSKSLGTTNNVASIDLALDGYYELSRVQIFEDNGTWEVDDYGLQCWNGFGFDAELFRVASGNVVKPGYNQMVLGGKSCTTNRVRVNFYNNGAVEVFGLKLFGTYHDVLHTNAGYLPLGVHKDNAGTTEDTMLNIAVGAPYIEALGDHSNPLDDWIYDHARPADWYGTYTRSTLALAGMYVRNCHTGVWTDVWATTAYVPREWPLQINEAAKTFKFFLGDWPDTERGFSDPDFDCWDDPNDFLMVDVNGDNVGTKVMHDGTSWFAYVATQK